MVQGTSKTTISGFKLTSANYTAAIDLLKKRFGNDSTIKRRTVELEPCVS